jgi:hypothetical protein
VNQQREELTLLDESNHKSSDKTLTQEENTTKAYLKETANPVTHHPVKAANTTKAKENTNADSAQTEYSVIEENTTKAYFTEAAKTTVARTRIQEVDKKTGSNGGSEINSIQIVETTRDITKENTNADSAQTESSVITTIDNAVQLILDSSIIIVIDVAIMEWYSALCKLFDDITPQ